MSHTENVVPLRVRIPLGETQGSLALALMPRLDAPDAPLSGFVARSRPELDAWAQRFAQAAVEIVGGDRPVSQLARWTTRDVYLDLERRALLVARAGGHHPGVARVQPVRPRVQSVHTCPVTDGVVEAAVHLRYGDRSRALAARFELRSSTRTDPRWVCTALEFA